ncbi:MAG: nucleotide sugar dehydrogenase [Alphaproteobacteria bacterium]
MRISIFGLGYVGTISAVCLAAKGHKVVGVDTNDTKVSLIAKGSSPIVETDLDRYLSEAVKTGALTATTDWRQAVAETDITMVCVGTPSQANGSLDLEYLSRVCEQIGEVLRDKTERHIVLIRSTILPGTMRDRVRPLLENASGKRAGEGFGLCFNPEFLREGSAIEDFYNPPKTVIGESDKASGDAVASLYSDLDAPLIRTDIRVAEMVKYMDNCWHALKVAFGNEVGAMAKVLGLDSHEVMDIFCQDTKLNISATYLKPGFAFGGSCLPKDLRAILHFAKSVDLDLPIFGSVLPSNELQIDRGFKLIKDSGARAIGLAGLSFKAETDDLRESPLVELAERLIGKGYDLRIYDPNVSLARLTGANRDYILNHIPHISRLLVDTPDELLSHAETVVVGNNDPKILALLGATGPQHRVIDLVRIPEADRFEGRYEGISW